MKKGFAIILLVLFTCLLAGCDSRKSYHTAKEECYSFLNKNYDKLNSVAEKVLGAKSSKNVSFNNIEVTYRDDDHCEVVEFDYDAQGMLGGQYWGFYYNASDAFDVNFDVEQYTKLDDNHYYWQEPDGNDFFAQERLSPEWFFYYEDFDGNVHGLNWATKRA